MKAVRRIVMLLAGLVGGLLLVEGALQLVRLAFHEHDSRRQVHADGSAGGDLRVLCLGACYTVGIGSPPEQSYPAHLERLLDAELADAKRDSVVLNRGVRGRTVDYFAARIEPILEVHRPDVLVVGVNRKMELEVAPGPPDKGVLDALLLPKMVQLARSPTEPEAAPTLANNGRTASTEMLQSADTEDYLSSQIRDLEAQLQTSASPDEVRSRLVNLYVARGDYHAARETYRQLLPPGPLRPDARMVLMRHALALGEYERAAEHLAAVQSVPELVTRFADGMQRRKRGYAARGQNVESWHTVDLGRLALLRGDLVAARKHLERALVLDPDLADAHHALMFVCHLDGEPLPAAAAATLDRATAVTSPPGFEAALDAHLRRIATAAQDSGTEVVLVHNFGALPEQTPVIERLVAAHGMHFVDLMAALEAEPDPNRLFDPVNHLRMSPHGNAWLATQVRGALDGLLVPLSKGG